MNPIRTNKPVFFGDDGEVLKSGKIYIGQPNQWPISFPKTVTFQDSAGSQFTATQPLRTNDQGRIVYNGKAIIALVDGDYSMLVRDHNDVNVADGYTPFVENTTEEANLTGVTQVGLLLSDIKQFNVTPGETVRNVGKATTLDALGADWLVVSATGSPADDIDLIDFANGTQGQRIKSQVYRKDIVSSGLFLLDEPVYAVSTNDATAYRNTWTNIDLSAQVPADAISAIVRIRTNVSYDAVGVADTLDVIANVRKNGSSAVPSPLNQVGQAYNRTNANDDITVGFVSEVTIPIDFGAAASFDLYLIVNDPTAGANNTTPDLDVIVVGYTINAKDLI